jgi:hypothetical protein
MPDHAFTPTLGLFDRWSFDSPLLANRLGDPTEREVLVHIPPEGVEAMDQGKQLGVVIYLAPLHILRPCSRWLEGFCRNNPSTP